MIKVMPILNNPQLFVHRRTSIWEPT